MPAQFKVFGFITLGMLLLGAQAQADSQGAIVFNPASDSGYCTLRIGATVYNSDHVTVLRTPSGAGVLQCLFEGTPVTSSIVYDNLYCFIAVDGVQSETQDARAVIRPNGTTLFSCHIGP